jgi:hypothetical protein
MAEQSNILILLYQEYIPLVLSFCPPLLLKTLLIIGPLKTKLYGIKGLLRAVVGKFLLLGSVWISDSGCKILMLYSLVEQKQRSATRLILNTNPNYTSFRIIRYIVRNTTISAAMRLFQPGIPFAITMPLRF